MDFRDLPREVQEAVELNLATSGQHGKLFAQIEKGELCAFCHYPVDNCKCSDDDE